MAAIEFAGSKKNTSGITAVKKTAENTSAIF